MEILDMKIPRIILYSSVLISLLVVSGCATPVDDDQSTQDVQQALETIVAQTKNAQFAVGTIVAQTLTAMPPSEDSAEPTGAAPVQASPTIANTQTLTATPFPTMTSTPVPTATAVSLIPMVEVSVPTNCRTGPGKAYDRVSILDVGKQVEIVGRNADSSYWVVENPGGTGECWLWGYYAVVTGQTSGLPVWQTPPTPTPMTTGVELKVSVPTNCRVGPGKLYDKVSVLNPGKTVKVVGRHATADFWVVENPEGSGTCWVWGYYATLTGPTANLPVWDPPPTPTPAVVTLSVRVDTNCRTGPGKPYAIVTILRIGKTAEVIGRNTDSTYWVINNPYGSGQCWVWGYYATVSGPAASLPILNPPPLP